MQIWVDADACPKVIKEILFRSARRLSIDLTLVANRPLAIPPSPRIRSLVVASGFDVADQAIVAQLCAGDLVITADIPLAAEVLAKGGHALSPRGERFTPDSIGERLAVRGWMEQLRASGIHSGGPPTLALTDRQAFANQLDRFLQQALRA